MSWILEGLWGGIIWTLYVKLHGSELGIWLGPNQGTDDGTSLGIYGAEIRKQLGSKMVTDDGILLGSILGLIVVNMK